MSRTPGRLLALFLAAGCPPPSAQDSDVLTSRGTSASSGSVEGSSTGDASDLTTGDAPATSTGAGDDSSTSTTTGTPEPAKPPRILDAEWIPDPLMEPGKATLVVEAADVTWVEAMFAGDTLVLHPVDGKPGHYTGEVEMISELSDGTYTATLWPFRGLEEGEPVERDLTVDLPQAGSEGHWEASPGLGEGLGGTILPGPDGDLFEFGTLAPSTGKPSCALRRRNADGTTGPNDYIMVQPGKTCTATDATVDVDGALLLLSEVTENGATLWQLDRHEPWNNSLVTEMFGTPGAKGNAVTVGPAGQIVVCGSAPGGPNDTDAAIWHANPDGSATFDDMAQPNTFSEVANDCAFLGDTLLLAGETAGPHPDALFDSKRHMVIDHKLNSKAPVWHVAPAGPGPLISSGATAIAVDGLGGYVTAAYVCEDNCFPQLEFRKFGPDGALVHSFRPAVKTTAPTAIAWHPAGYAVITAGEIITGNWMKMWAQAWIPGEKKELWTYSQSHTEGIHWALDVAIGQYGWIHLVGVADLGNLLVPAFVSLYP